MGKSKIALAGPSTSVTHVTWKRVKTIRGSRDKMVKITPRKKTGYAKVNLNQSPTRPACVSVEQPDCLLNDDEIPYPYLHNLCPPRHLKILKNQNQYLQEWLPHQQRYFSILLDMEAPPAPQICMSCGGDGIYRVKQWNGTFFEESSLRLDSPVQLVVTSPRKSPLMMKMNGKMWRKTEANTFEVTKGQKLSHGGAHQWDTLLQSMNYYSKLWRITSSGFPHLVPQGFHTSPKDAGPGELVLFCLACPQPGVNIPKEGIDLSWHVQTGSCRWTFARTLVMDGNFKAEHMHPKDPNNEVWLMDDKDFMVESMPYNYSRGQTVAITVLSIMQMLTEINWHLPALVVVPVQGMGALYHMQCLALDFGTCMVIKQNALSGHVDGEIMETLWSSLNIISLSAQALSLNKKIKGAQWSCAATEEDFAALDNNVWIDQAEREFAEQASKPETMDIFEVQLEKARGPAAGISYMYSQGLED
ncbi:hypothetical protein J3A83DRAFT_4189822 [Scleroderma citrinum]